MRLAIYSTYFHHCIQYLLKIAWIEPIVLEVDILTPKILTLLDPGYFFPVRSGGDRFRPPPWISVVEPLLKLGWTTILERYKRGPRIQKMRCLASKLREWRPFKNSDLKSDFLENCHWSSHLLSKFWEGDFKSAAISRWVIRFCSNRSL